MTNHNPWLLLTQTFQCSWVHSLITNGGNNLIGTNLIIFNSAALIIFLLLIYFVSRTSNASKKLTNTYLFGAFFGNVAYIGPSFINNLFKDSSGTVSILIAIHIFITFTVGLYILEKNNKDDVKLKNIAKSLIKNPLIIAILVGIILFSLQIQLPDPIVQFLSMLAKSASPVVLIAIGTFLIENWTIKKGVKHGITISALKLIVMPLFFMTGFAIFSQSQNLTISILEAAMPVALTNFALSEIYEMDQHAMSSAIIISTIVSAITLSVFALVLV
jgi:predicted permease